VAATLPRVGRRLLGVAVFLAALGLWEAWARYADSFLIPPASAVLQKAWNVWPTSEFLTGVAASLERLAAGYVVGAGIGIGLGLLMGSSRRTRRALEPVVELARATPAIAILPVAIVLLGVGDEMQVSVIAFGVTFPVLVNTIEGVRGVSPETRDTASMLHVGAVERVVRVYAPSALPSIVAGLRVAISIGLILVVVSEFFASGEGLGYYIRFQQAQFDVTAMYCGIVFLGLLGYTLNRLFLLVEHRVLFWHYGSVGEPAR
jgi:ABC-type nitrate/sulfonate/bicarbonate transport system permease component